MPGQDKWTREQLIMALNVYCKIPFKDVKEWHPIIQKYAPIIGRTPVALKMKVGNFGRFDPSLRERGITGLGHGSAAEEPVWNEFWGNAEKLAFESERLFAERMGENIEDYVHIEATDLPQGKDRLAVVKQRVNQKFFRETVLCSYLYQCCITGVTNTSLLEACHILSWAEDKDNRTNPKNGLCMNPFFHKAYDNFLMSITPDYTIAISEKLIDGVRDSQFRDYLTGIRGGKIILPEKFAPERDYLAKHFQLYQSKQ